MWACRAWRGERTRNPERRHRLVTWLTRCEHTFIMHFCTWRDKRALQKALTALMIYFYPNLLFCTACFAFTSRTQKSNYIRILVLSFMDEFKGTIFKDQQKKNHSLLTFSLVYLSFTANFYKPMLLLAVSGCSFFFKHTRATLTRDRLCFLSILKNYKNMKSSRNYWLVWKCIFSCCFRNNMYIKR